MNIVDKLQKVSPSNDLSYTVSAILINIMQYSIQHLMSKFQYRKILRDHLNVLIRFGNILSWIVVLVSCRFWMVNEVQRGS